MVPFNDGALLFQSCIGLLGDKSDMDLRTPFFASMGCQEFENIFLFPQRVVKTEKKWRFFYLSLEPAAGDEVVPVKGKTSNLKKWN